MELVRGVITADCRRHRERDSAIIHFDHKSPTDLCFSATPCDRIEIEC